MEVISPLSNFSELLKQVNQTAQKYGSKLRMNEAATRAALIDPLLKALGWDATNPEMVEFERTFNKTRVDYALLDCTGNVAVIVEAKALGGDLRNPVVTTQILSYGFTYSLKNIILTDGLIWNHYLSAEPGNYSPESIDISSDSLIKCGDFFLRTLDAFRFWQSNPEPVIERIQPPVIPAVISNPIEVVNKPEPASVSQSSEFQPLTSLPKDLHGRAAPKSLRLPDGKVVSIKFWRDILADCVEFVLQHNPSVPIPLPDKARKKINLLNYEKREVVKIAQIPMTYNEKTIYVHLNYDTNNIIANSIYILGFLPKGKAWKMAEVAF